MYRCHASGALADDLPESHGFKFEDQCSVLGPRQMNKSRSLRIISEPQIVIQTIESAEALMIINESEHEA